MKYFHSRTKARRISLYPSHLRARPFNNNFLKKVNALKKTIPDWDNFFAESANETREDQWVRLDVLASPLTDKYAWAIPDDRALNILQAYQPLVEIGCGKGYWCRLLQERGVDIRGYDLYPQNFRKGAWTDVTKGGPETLLSPAGFCFNTSSPRNLFLCYPDEAEAMSLPCLNNFQGEYVVHVGELIHTGTMPSYPQSPWGRTTSSDFQVQLAEDFHCILVVELPRFPFSKDCISVWKRTRYVNGRYQEPSSECGDGEGDDQSSDSKSSNGSMNSSEEHGEHRDDNQWADVPKDERISFAIAAPCAQHLL